MLNKETKKRIQEIARQLNYIPNYSAKSLVLRRSYNIGVFFSTLSMKTSPSFFHQVIKGVNGVIKDQYNLVVKGIDDCNFYETVNSQNFDGIIIVSQQKEDDIFIQDGVKKKIPLVVLNREVVDIPGIHCFLSDDQVGACNAVEHLIHLGHEKLGMITGPHQFSATENRKLGYLQALKGNGILARQEYILEGNFDALSGYKEMKNLLSLPDPPTAVFCSNDDMAVGAMKAAKEMNIHIPEDLSIVGFDDNGFSEYMTPALTTVKRHIQEISAQGAQCLLSLIEKEEHRESQSVHFIHTEVIKRNSAVPLR